MIYSSVVACDEINGSRQEDYGVPLTGSSRVTLRCAWNDAIDLVSDLLDNRLTDPLHPGLFATTASVKAFGDESTSGYTGVGQGIIPNEAAVTVTYQNLSDEERAGNPSGDPNADWYTENIEPTMEFMTVNHLVFQWGNATDPSSQDLLKSEEAPGRIMMGCKLVRNWRKLASLPVGTFSLIGKVNSLAYTSTYLDGEVFAPETLLYQPPVSTRSVNRSGASTWDLKLMFHYKEQTWNKFWRATTQTYERIYLGRGWTASGTPEQYNNHNLADLSTLLA